MNKVFTIHPSILKGHVSISGAKNSVLKLLTASLLTNEKITISNFPKTLLDTQIKVKMLELLNKKITIEDKTIIIEEEKNLKTELIWSDRSVRTTLLVLGALLTRFGKAKVPLPGGCDLGTRGYDLHLMIFEKMGATVWQEEGYLCAQSNNKLKGQDIFFPIRSTGATENAIICGTLAEGTTRVWNPHVRPEIIDLIEMLNKMGSEINVYGQQYIEIKGKDKLFGTQHHAIPDNMEALTWLIGAAITGGDIEIHNFPYKHLEVPLIHLRESGCKIFVNENNNSIIVRNSTPYPIEISTGPYPGINSDMQPIFAVYAAVAKGQSKIVDLRFPDRYQYTQELAKMGVKCEIKNNILIIHGGYPLKGTHVKALDLRAGAALLLAGLVAEGKTTIEDFWMIQRGYDNIIEKLESLTVKKNESDFTN